MQINLQQGICYSCTGTADRGFQPVLPVPPLYSLPGLSNSFLPSFSSLSRNKYFVIIQGKQCIEWVKYEWNAFQDPIIQLDNGICITKIIKNTLTYVIKKKNIFYMYYLFAFFIQPFFHTSTKNRIPPQHLHSSSDYSPLVIMKS